VWGNWDIFLLPLVGGDGDDATTVSPTETPPSSANTFSFGVVLAFAVLLL
jgi:hypothetical protein